MTPLPERKKSAEELAKLRDSLGIGAAPPPPFRGDLPTAGELPAAPAAVAPPEIPATAKSVQEEARPQPPIEPLPRVDEREPKSARSLKRSERIPVLPVEETPVLGSVRAETRELRLPTPLPAPQLGPKMVRSLRKSEQAPRPAPAGPPADSTLPQHRHSDNELEGIRRRESLSHLGAAPPTAGRRAHLVILIPGYLFAATSAVYFWNFDIGRQYPWVTAACAGAALIIALWILLRASFSRHHAAFITVVALFAVVFAALYYFPHLQYGP